MTELPSSFYYIVGFLIMTNLSTVGTIIWFGVKAIWWTSKLDSRVEIAHETAVRAHKRLDKLDFKIKEH